MKKNTAIFVFLVIFSRLSLSLSSLVGGAIGDVIYVLSFAIPVAVGFVYAERDKLRREEIAGVREGQRRLFSLSGNDVPLIIPLLFPSVLAVFGLSFLTQIVLSLFGMEYTPYMSEGFWEGIMIHAFAPTVTEEMLFRFLPLILLLPYGKRRTIILSSVLFSLYHLNAHQYVYALFAGVIFIVADIVFDSVIPSLILHAFNNAMSVVWGGISDERASIVFIVGLSVLALISVAAIMILKEKYRIRLNHNSGGKEYG